MWKEGGDGKEERGGRAGWEKKRCGEREGIGRRREGREEEGERCGKRDGKEERGGRAGWGKKRCGEREGIGRREGWKEEGGRGERCRKRITFWGIANKYD